MVEREGPEKIGQENRPPPEVAGYVFYRLHAGDQEQLKAKFGLGNFRIISTAVSGDTVYVKESALKGVSRKRMNQARWKK